MNIQFAPIDDSYIKHKVKEGYYSNATELVRDAVRRMRERDDDLRARFLACVERGEQDSAAGRTVPYTPELLDMIMQEARQHAVQGRKPNPDVLP